MNMNSWKFTSLPSEVDITRIVREASEALDDTHAVIRITVGRQVFTLCSRQTWLAQAPKVQPLGLVTRRTRLDGWAGEVGPLGLCPVEFGGSDAVVIFNQDIAQKLRGAVETKVEVF